MLHTWIHLEGEGIGGLFFFLFSSRFYDHLVVDPQETHRNYEDVLFSRCFKTICTMFYFWNIFFKTSSWKWRICFKFLKRCLKMFSSNTWNVCFNFWQCFVYKMFQVLKHLSTKHRSKHLKDVWTCQRDVSKISNIFGMTKHLVIKNKSRQPFLWPQREDLSSLMDLCRLSVSGMITSKTVEQVPKLSILSHTMVIHRHYDSQR